MPSMPAELEGLLEQLRSCARPNGSANQPRPTMELPKKRLARATCTSPPSPRRLGHGGGGWPLRGARKTTAVGCGHRARHHLGINWIDTARSTAQAIRGGRGSHAGEVPRRSGRTSSPSAGSCGTSSARSRIASRRLDSTRGRSQSQNGWTSTDRPLSDHWPVFPPGRQPRLEEAWTTLASSGARARCATSASRTSTPRSSPAASRSPHHEPAAAVFDAATRTSKTTSPWCQAHQVGVIVYSPMQSGLLSAP